LTSLRAAHADDPKTLIVEELAVCDGSARVDIAVLNGSLSGFEIKSERDSLSRLKSQTKSYERCFDTLTLVAPARHLNHARSTLPEWWGLTEVTEERARKWTLKTWRHPTANNGVDAASIIGLLWRSEIFAVLERYRLDRGIRSKPMVNARERLLEHLDVQSIREEVRLALKSRGIGDLVQRRFDVVIRPYLPPSLCTPRRTGCGCFRLDL